MEITDDDTADSQGDGQTVIAHSGSSISDLVVAKNFNLKIPFYFQGFLRNRAFQLRRSLFGSQSAKASEIKKLIKQVRRIWIDGKLNRSLAAGVPVQLQYVELTSNESLPSRWRSMGEVQDATGNSTLVLGKPGTGKTTGVLLYVRELLERSAQGDFEPIPIVLSLASWTKQKGHLLEWLPAEMVKVYGIGEDACRSLLDDDRSVLILDGADEVGRGVDKLFVAIRYFLMSRETNCIITCRADAYDNSSEKLRMRGSVEVRELGGQDVLAYVAGLGARYLAVRELLEINDTALNVCRIPLMLNFVLSLVDRSDSLQQLRSEEVSERDLLDHFFLGGFQFKTTDWTPATVAKYLGNLAIAAEPGEGVNRIDLTWVGERWPDEFLDLNFDTDLRSGRKRFGPTSSEPPGLKIVWPLRVVEAVARLIGMLLATGAIFEIFRLADNHFGATIAFHANQWIVTVPVYLFIFWSGAKSKPTARSLTVGNSIGEIAIVAAYLLALFFSAGLLWWVANWSVLYSNSSMVVILLVAACAPIGWKWYIKDKNFRRAVAYGVNVDQFEWPSLKQVVRDKGIIPEIVITLVIFSVVLCIMKIADSPIQFFSMVQYLAAFCIWMFMIVIAGSFMVSVVYFFAIRMSGMIPWRLGRFMRAMVRSGVLERNGHVFQFAHQTYFSYFKRKSRYFPQLFSSLSRIGNDS